MTIRSVVWMGALLALGCGTPAPENGGQIVGESETSTDTGTLTNPCGDQGGDGGDGTLCGTGPVDMDDDPPPGTTDGPDETDTGEGETGTGTTGGTGETGVVEECPPPSEFGDWCDGCSNTLAVNLLNDCDILDCGLTQQGSGFDETGGDGPIEYDDAQICFFEAMRDRTPAKLRIVVSKVFVGGTVMRYVDADGTILETDLSWSDDASCTEDWDPIERCTLQEPAYFTECLTTTDELTMEACEGWNGWSTGCSVVTVEDCPG